MTWTIKEAEGLVYENLVLSKIPLMAISRYRIRTDKEFFGYDMTDAIRRYQFENNLDEDSFEIMEIYSKLSAKWDLDIRKTSPINIFLSEEICEFFTKWNYGDIKVSDIPILKDSPIRIFPEKKFFMPGGPRGGENVRSIVIGYAASVSNLESEHQGKIINSFHVVANLDDNITSVARTYDENDKLSDMIDGHNCEGFCMADSLMIVAAACFYRMSSNADILRRINPKYDEMIEKAKSIKSQKKRRDAHKAAEREKNEMFFMGLELKKLQRRAREKEIKKSIKESIGDHTVSEHVVREHVRRQRVGPGRAFIKETVVSAHKRGQGKKKTASVAIP